MALGAVLAAQLTDHSSRAATLTVAGVDVLKSPAINGGNAYGVDPASVSITENGPGGVSSMEFTIEDPLGVVTIPSPGDEVVFWVANLNEPEFGGYVQARTLTVNGIGRNIVVTCQGYEAILDWAVLLADVTLASGLTVQDAILSVAALAEGTFGLRAFGSAGASSQAQPVAQIAQKIGPNATLAYAVTITAGTSLRSALDQIGTAGLLAPTGAGLTDPSPAVVLFSVDFWRGLRALKTTTAAWAADYNTLTISDTVAGPIRAEGLQDTTDGSSIVRGIWITGANAAGTGYMDDGTGLPGRIAYLTDTTIDTAQKLANAQVAYLGKYGASRRGTFRLTDWTPTAMIRAGSAVSITDAQVSMAAVVDHIFSIRKSFYSNLDQDWQVTYGGLAPSAMTLVRRLTRTIRA